MTEEGTFILEEKNGWEGDLLRIWKRNPDSSEVDVDFFDPDFDLAVATAQLRVWDGSDYFAAELGKDEGNALHLNEAIVELGSGIGFLGLFLAQRGHGVLLTDVSTVAETVLARNVKENTVAESEGGMGGGRKVVSMGRGNECGGRRVARPPLLR